MVLLLAKPLIFTLSQTSLNLSNKLQGVYLNFKTSKFYEILQFSSKILNIRFEICKDM